MGTDPLHPGFGSVLDGGVRQDGEIVSTIIGEVDPGLISSFVNTEINRIIKDHQEKQLGRAQEDQIRYSKTTLTDGEILDDADVEIFRDNDAMVIRITLISGSETHTLSIPVLLN